MSKQSAAKKIQRKAERRIKRKLPVAELTEDELEEQDSAPSATFDPVKDSPGGE